MELMGKAAKVSKQLERAWDIPWEIISSENDQPYKSDSFSFMRQSWFFGLTPSGVKNKSVPCVGFGLHKEFSGPPICLTFSVHFEISNGKKFGERHQKCTFQEAMWGHGWDVPKSELLERMTDSSSPHVIVVFTIKSFSTCDPKIQKMVNDFNGMIKSGNHSDITVQVKGKEFKLHRNILSARNPFFYAMFECDMREKITGIATIDDCVPNVFHSFVHFLYTGKVDKLTSENVFEIYEISDKYQENLLKAECLQFMMNSITVDNFCDYLIVAFKYDEKELFSRATKFFVGNTREIISNARWVTFLKDHPVYANELHIKSLDSYTCSSRKRKYPSNI